MQQEFLVESRSYDQMLRGSWRAYKLDEKMRLGDELWDESTNNGIRVWLPAGTPMRWATGTRPLRSNCLQFFWPERWYMLSAFYDDLELKRTYANIIQPPIINLNRVAYVDLDLSILVEPDLTYEVLTQAEFDQLAETLHYDEETRISALMAMRMLTNSIMLGVGLFATIPQRLRQTEFHLAKCGNRF